MYALRASFRCLRTGIVSPLMLRSLSRAPSCPPSVLVSVRSLSAFAQPPRRRLGRAVLATGCVVAASALSAWLYVRRDGLAMAARMKIYKGQFLENKGQYAEAEALYRAAIAETTADAKRADAPGLLFAILRLGNLLVRPEVRRSHDAEALFRRAMHVLHKKEDAAAMVEVSLKLADVYASVGRRDLALSGIEWAVAKARELAGPNPHASPPPSPSAANSRALLAMSLESLGSFWVSVGDPSSAVALFLEAGAIAATTHGNVSRQVGAMLTSACAAAYAAGDLPTAEHTGGEAYKVAAALAKNGDESLSASALYNYGRVLFRTGRTREGRECIVRAVEVAHRTQDGEALAEIQAGLGDADARTELGDIVLSAPVPGGAVLAAGAGGA